MEQKPINLKKELASLKKMLAEYKKNYNKYPDSFTEGHIRFDLASPKFWGGFTTIDTAEQLVKMFDAFNNLSNVKKITKSINKTIDHEGMLDAQLIAQNIILDLVEGYLDKPYGAETNDEEHFKKEKEYLDFCFPKTNQNK